MPFSTEQLLFFRMSDFLQISSILLVRILVKILQRVSSKVIGLVLLMSILQSVALGMGIILALFHSFSILLLRDLRNVLSLIEVM